MTIETALDAVERRIGQAISHSPTELSVGGHVVPLPGRGKWDDLHARHALPFSVRGEARENLLYSVVQDAGPDRDRVLDDDLYEKLPSAIEAPGLVNTDTLADAMRDEYWWTAKKDPHLLPFHAELPTGFDHTSRSRTGRKPARYKMFAGYILPFLAWDGEKPDVDLMDELLAAIEREDGFTLVDELFVAAARSVADGVPPTLSSMSLVERATGGHDDMLVALESSAGGPFCQNSFNLFRRDMRTVLQLGLPRAELIRALTLVISLHLGVYYYRFALVLALDIEAVNAATAGNVLPRGCSETSLGSCPLAGAMKFRAPSSGFRRVSTESPCRQSYLGLDRDRLLALPANIITANLFERTWAALTGEPSSEGAPRPYRVAERLQARPDMRDAFDAATAALAVLYAQQAGADALAERVALRSPGPFALQSAILQARRTRLKHTSRDVVNQLVYRPGEGTLLRRNGRSLYYFELDDDMLFLLVKLVCAGTTMAFDAFVARLADYGLAPQDAQEADALAATLEQFGMLDRYSDAGESTFVHDIG